MEELPGAPVIWSFPVLEPRECAAVIARIEELGPRAAPISTAGGPMIALDTRNNTRVMFDDHGTAGLLWRRTHEALVPTFERWRLHGLNERFRCYRYRPGQFFAPHRDGAFHRSDDERSLFTFMVYLNDDFEGGETVFHGPKCTVRPRVGMALVFFHPIIHEGGPVLRGTKYVMRTDVMYRKAHE